MARRRRSYSRGGLGGFNLKNIAAGLGVASILGGGILGAGAAYVFAGGLPAAAAAYFSPQIKGMVGGITGGGNTTSGYVFA